MIIYKNPSHINSKAAIMKNMRMTSTVFANMSNTFWNNHINNTINCIILENKQNKVQLSTQDFDRVHYKKYGIIINQIYENLNIEFLSKLKHHIDDYKFLIEPVHNLNNICHLDYHGNILQIDWHWGERKINKTKEINEELVYNILNNIFTDIEIVSQRGRNSLMYGLLLYKSENSIILTDKESNIIIDILKSNGFNVIKFMLDINNPTVYIKIEW